MIVPNAESTDVESLLTPWRISTERYLEMIDEGVFERSGDRVELVRGMIVDMSPMGPEHHYVLTRLAELFFPVRGQHKLSVQGTLVVGEGQIYDPDIMLLRKDAQGYRNRLPHPADVALLIEVSGSSLAKDRRIKQPEYAKAGVPEFWIADLEAQAVTIHREPGAGGYQQIETRIGKQPFSAACLPGVWLNARDLFD